LSTVHAIFKQNGQKATEIKLIPMYLFVYNYTVSGVERVGHALIVVLPGNRALFPPATIF
jgi:hypothetical protein